MDLYSTLKEFLDTPEKVERRKLNHPYCQECLAGVNPKSYIGSQPERRSRELVIERGDPACSGIYLQEDYELGLAYLHSLGHTELTLHDVKCWLNPSYWITTHLSLKGEPFKPYWYQDRALKCTTKQKLLRMSRRAGKTEMMAALILYLLFMSPTPSYKILALCPQKPQAKEIFDHIMELRESNDDIMDATRIRQSPYLEVTVLATKNRLRIFTAGSKSGSKALSARGQGAQLLILDEMDHLSDDDVATITPILTDIGGGNFIGASTLKGPETFFFRYCHTTNIKEFYVPFKARPDWTPDKEMTARDSCMSQLQWDLEYDVKWVGQISGVFQKMFVAAAFTKKRYQYGSLDYSPEWSYFIGVDWNGDNNGTRIMVIGYDPHTRRVYSIQKDIVSFEGWTQSAAITRIVELNRAWNPKRIVIDKGFGQFQDEVIRSVGLAAEMDLVRNPDLQGDAIHADIRLKEIVDVVDFGGKIDIPHVYTTPDGVQKYAKQYLIENLQRFFEQGDICLAQDDELRIQLVDYVVAKFSNKGPVYKAGLAGDHDLDALALAVFGFAKVFHPEFRESKPVLATGIVTASLEELKQAMNSERVTAPKRQELREEQPKKFLPAYATDNYKKNLKAYTGLRSISTGKSGISIDRIFRRGW